MARSEKPVKLSVTLHDKGLYEAVRHAAADQDRPMREIVAEALRQWLERLEEDEDLAAIAEVAGEPTLPWDEVKADMRRARKAAHAE